MQKKKGDWNLMRVHFHYGRLVIYLSNKYKMSYYSLFLTLLEMSN
jgi:hypothetical protein